LRSCPLPSSSGALWRHLSPMVRSLKKRLRVKNALAGAPTTGVGDAAERFWIMTSRSGKAARLRAHRQADAVPGMPVWDGRGMYLLPGLIDLDVHLVWDGSSDPVEQLREESTEQTLLRAVRHARETLEAGITTIRDLGSVEDLAIDLSRAVRCGDVVGPRIVPSGRTIIM
jgi:imidazolonepropionase-like amidohydrolase